MSESLRMPLLSFQYLLSGASFTSIFVLSTAAVRSEYSVANIWEPSVLDCKLWAT